jgi:hypothetical protein
MVLISTVRFIIVSKVLNYISKNKNNQIISLSNVVKRLENSEELISNSDSKYKEATLALLDHFKDQLQVIDGQVVDPYSGARPKFICEFKED